MKKLLLPIFTVLLATLVIAFLPTEAEASIYDDTIRLHILANSDTEEDQQIKLYVRDKLLREYSEIFKSSLDIREAEAVLKEELPAIESAVNEFVSDYGYSARARLDIEWFDTRYYEDFSLPAGYYLSLIIELGEAEGRNWWCVMYPPMCLDTALKTECHYTEAQEDLIIGKYRVKFKILELISKSMHKK